MQDATDVNITHHAVHIQHKSEPSTKEITCTGIIRYKLPEVGLAVHVNLILRNDLSFVHNAVSIIEAF
ncbi:hypothetical protein OUZ56_030476 [Daphnia magna]|uniref:Uncharacterized protein n=1 Tax=Daphnia magna TaxID=35525 RepID=A0ABQ9ZRE2_9CRUS|nr:hypothetical protein OUZ56_030476 [Daphnia magna]